jgi:hypothetical protein
LGLRVLKDGDPKKIAIEANAGFLRFPNFAMNRDQIRPLKAELYKVLLLVVQGKKMVEVADQLIKASGGTRLT